MCDISSSFRVGSTTRHFIISLVQQNTVTCFSLRGQQKHFASVLGKLGRATKYLLRFRASSTCYGVRFRASNMEYLLRPIGQDNYKGKEEKKRKPGKATVYSPMIVRQLLKLLVTCTVKTVRVFLLTTSS